MAYEVFCTGSLPLFSGRGGLQGGEAIGDGPHLAHTLTQRPERPGFFLEEVLARVRGGAPWAAAGKKGEGLSGPLASFILVPSDEGVDPKTLTGVVYKGEAWNGCTCAWPFPRSGRESTLPQPARNRELRSRNGGGSAVCV